ncbi:MAG: hypothetical protein ACKOAU_09960 [Pirellula sp.]
MAQKKAGVKKGSASGTKKKVSPAGKGIKKAPKKAAKTQRKGKKFASNQVVGVIVDSFLKEPNTTNEYRVNLRCFTSTPGIPISPKDFDYAPGELSVRTSTEVTSYPYSVKEHPAVTPGSNYMIIEVDFNTVIRKTKNRRNLLGEELIVPVITTKSKKQ